MQLWIYCFYFVLNINIGASGPVCEEPYAYIEVAEDTAVGTVVKEIRCGRSTTSNTDLTYAIKDGNTNGKFGMNTTNGVGFVFVYQSISFESRTTSFQLSIEVSENTPYRASVNIILDIQVTGVNDYAPLFLFSPYTVYINEDVGPGKIISKPIPYDFDKGNDGSTTSSIIDGDDTLFYMDPKTAKVYLRKDLDYERQTDYVITIQVTDNGIPERRSSTSVINVHVKDVNDNPPICEDTYMTEAFDETKEEGAVIKFIKCVDADAGNNGRLSYTIAEGDYTKFRLQGPYLILSKQVDVDREPQVWALSVRVRDRGNPRLSTVVDIVLYVEGVDDNSPIWAPPYGGQYSIDLEENTPIGTRVIQIAADDLDKSDSHDAPVIYYMDDYTHMFTIKPKTGDIFLNHDLDREKVSSYRIPVSAVSVDNPADRITTDVIINVIDVNDYTPEFEKDVFQYFIREDVEVQTEIANVTARDLDINENGDVVYMIIGGNTDSVFDVNTQTGIVSVVGRLDYESETSYSVLVRAMDRGRPARSVTCTVIISIIPVNEFEPLVRDMNAVDILEDTSIGQSIFRIEASDGDNGSDGTLMYAIVSEGYPFTIEPLTGVVRLLHKLDRETIDTYNVRVEVSDMSESQPKSTMFSAKVNVLDVNDNIPMCDMFYVQTLFPPIQSGNIIVTLNCTDADDGQNGKLSYTIVSGNINSDMSISYEGALTVLRNPSSAEYRLEIEIRDGGTPSYSTRAIAVILTGSKPMFKNLPGSVDIAENAGIGKSVFQVQSMSVSKQIKYEITEIYIDNDNVATQDSVKIDMFTGIIYTWKQLDRETTETIKVVVTATDLISGIEADSTLAINIVDVNDNAPRFDKNIYNIAVVENIPPATSLLRVTVTDLDSGNFGQFDLSIDENTNAIVVIDDTGTIKTRSDIDREITDRFTLVITAVDRGHDIKFTSTATVLVLVIDSDEYSPEFIDAGSNLETSLSEDTPLGSQIFVMEARDFDVKAELTYSFQNLKDGNFLIDDSSGSIYLSRLLDREEQDRYTLVVQVVDEGQRTATATVTVIVTDVNDNDPRFESHISKLDVSENEAQGYIVDSILVHDDDLEQNGQTSLSIVNGNIDGTFDIRGFDLVLAGTLDYNTITQYLLILEASDHGSPRRTSSATVIVEVEPDLKQPLFAVEYQEVNIPENLFIGYVVFDFDASLRGAIEGTELIYSLLSGNANGLFGLDKKTGQLTVARKLDRELNGDFHKMIVIATNIYDTNLRASTEVDVYIDDINDVAPTFLNDRYLFDVKENEMKGIIIGKVSAEDNDYGRNSEISYEISGGEENGETFSIDSRTGELSLKRQVNYIFDQIFHFSVKAYDHGSPSLTGKTMLTVNIVDMNNNAPKFDQKEFTVSIRENVKAGKQVYQINAQDDDSGINGEVLFRIIEGNRHGCFELDSENGELRTSKPLDREKVDTFSLVIEAEDKGTPPLTGSCVVTVFVSDVNDNIPLFNRPVYTVSMNRFGPIEAFVISVSALDTDLGENAKIDYQLVGKHEKYFQIDSASGRIYTFADLSLFEENGIEVTVVAKDRGTPKLSSSATIDVQLHPTKFKEIEDYSFSVSEYDPPNQFIGTLGTQSGMKYAIEKGNFKNNFRISEDDGNIFLRGILDREEYSDYFLIVNSYHRLTPNLENKLNVHIKVIDENDNSPGFSQEEYTFLVLEHTPIGFSVAQVTAIDNDSGENGHVYYFIVEEEPKKFFTVDVGGNLYVKESLSYQRIDKLNFTVVAKDNGQFSRRGSSDVVIDIIDIDESSFDFGNGHQSNLLSVQVPVTATSGYVAMTLKPSDFGLGVTKSKVRYLGHDNKQIFEVKESSGDIILRKSGSITPGVSHWIWVIANVIEGTAGTETMVMIRVDSFQPGRHVVVFTHAASYHILDLNRDGFTAELQNIFPSAFPVIWKIEGDHIFSRRKLLQLNSKSYVYFLRGNQTRLGDPTDGNKRFYHQDELIDMLTERDGRVSEKLNSEQFDNFHVIAVDRFTEPEVDGQPWIKTPMGLLTIALCITIPLLILCLVMVVLMSKKKKCHGGLFPKLKMKVGNEQSPYPKSVEPLYNNIKSQKSSMDNVPVMETLRLLAKMSEEERNEILQNAFNTKQTNGNQTLNTNTSSISSSAQFCVQDEMQVKPPRKISNESAAVKTKTNDNKSDPPEKSKHNAHSTSSTAIVEYQTDSGKSKTEDGRKTSKEERPPDRRRSTLTSESVSSLELATNDELAASETASESEVIVSESNTEAEQNNKQPIKNNKTLIIGGKEYDGVGKDTKTNGKYLYNTRTGEKLHVTDDVLKRAVEQRHSVVQPGFNEAPHGGRLSTFKRPLKRKMSRSRFSTTTIWEMSVDVENGAKSDDAGSDQVFIANDDLDKTVDRDEDTNRQRRVGVDHSPKVKQLPECLTLEHDGSEHCVDGHEVDNNATDDKADSTAESDETVSSESSEEDDQIEELTTERIQTPKQAFADDSINRKISANFKWETLLANTGVKPDTIAENGNKMNNKWTKASKIVKYVRPIYKPMNLDNVTCKVPKGKSDPKDCLSKDPVYAGWAKMVGRRIKKKVVKTKDGPSKTVVSREGRSLPASLFATQTTSTTPAEKPKPKPKDVVTYTKIVSSLTPPHLAKKRLSIK